MAKAASHCWSVFKNKSQYRLLFLTLLLVSLVLITFILIKPTTLELAKFIDKPSSNEELSTPVNQQYIQDLQTKLYKHPNNVQFATQLARYYLQQSKQKAGERELYLYLAKDTLQPWWNQSNPPLEVLSLRAHLYQAQHQFSLARADLKQLLEAKPHHANAAFSLAMLQQIQGDYTLALQSCKSLLNSRQLILSSLCQASVQSVNGQAQRAYKVLKILLAKMSADDNWKQWTLSAMADIANRLGKPQAAEQYYQQALAIPSQDAYLKVRYADFLLSQQRAADLLQHFSAIAQDKQLLLRQAYAAQLLNKTQDIQRYAGYLSRELISKPQQEQKNNEQSQHPAMLAYYYLHINKQPDTALFFAKMNWKKQKSNEDLHLLLQAALVTQDNKVLEMVTKWREKTALEDIALTHLLSIKKLL